MYIGSFAQRLGIFRQQRVVASSNAMHERRRAAVSVVAATFQQAGIIRYQDGSVQILDRAALEDASCECYRVVSAEFQRLSC